MIQNEPRQQILKRFFIHDYFTCSIETRITQENVGKDQESRYNKIQDLFENKRHMEKSITSLLTETLILKIFHQVLVHLCSWHI